MRHLDMHDAERKIVRIAAQIHLNTARDEALLECWDQPHDGACLSDIAAREGMAGIVSAELQRIGARSPTDRTSLELLFRIVEPLFARSGAHVSELLALGDTIGAEGLRVIVLKGGALLETVYQGRLALRPLSDIDLLVEPAQRSAIEAVLRARGFVAPPPTPNLFCRDQLVFDLHTDVVSSERIRGRSTAFRLDSRRVREHARPLGDGSRGLFVLSDVHQFLHASIHALKHSYSRLLWIVDLAHLARRVDWNDMIDEAEATGTLRSVAYSCHILERALAVELPSGWSGSLPPLSRIERAFVSGVVRRSDTLTMGELLVAMSIPSKRERAAYVLELVFPRRAVLAKLFPYTPSWLLLPRRLAQILVRSCVKAHEMLRNLGRRSSGGGCGPEHETASIQ